MHPPRAHSISPHIPQNLTLSSQTYNKRPQLFYISLVYIFHKNIITTIKDWELLWHILSICALPKGQACECRPLYQMKIKLMMFVERVLDGIICHFIAQVLNEKQSLQFWNIIFIHGEGQEFPFCGSILHTSFFRSGQLQYDKLWDLNGCCVAELQHK